MSKRKLYMQVYDYYKTLIESGKLSEGTKLPSIRRCAEERAVSKTTIEQAYMCLCDDGYAVPKSQSGYYVSKRGRSPKSISSPADSETGISDIVYDFSSSGVDSESFNLDIWRRYVKSALRQNDRLLYYGEPRGEGDLRREIAKYARETRNCVCDENSIVIGAGVQTLLSILCPLLSDKKNVSFDDILYKQGVAVFKDHGFSVVSDRSQGDVIYTSPSYITKWGDTMSVRERFSLTEYAQKNGKLIIEDDYGSEFRYFNRPTPSLQGLDGGENTVYLGTFSKLLLPSIRISFMILPPVLNEKYCEKGTVYNQTVSKSEQIALCSYIRDGHLSAQIRKSRKLYTQKAKLLSDLLTNENDGKIIIEKSNSPLYVCCKTDCGMTANEIYEKAKLFGISLIPVGDEKKSAKIALSVSSVGSEKFNEAVFILKNKVLNVK